MLGLKSFVHLNINIADLEVLETRLITIGQYLTKTSTVTAVDVI
jgi:hypothetical protein